MHKIPIVPEYLVYCVSRTFRQHRDIDGNVDEILQSPVIADLTLKLFPSGACVVALNDLAKIGVNNIGEGASHGSASFSPIQLKRVLNSCQKLYAASFT